MPSKIPTWKSPLPSRSASRYDRTVDRRAAKAFYKSPGWRAVRLLVLRRDPLCVDCLKAGLTVASVHVHHKIERRERPDLALDPENLEGLCQPCHNKKRAGHER